MLRSTKRFVMLDESVNSYGFRVLINGVDLTQFKKNPLMLWMHNRAWRGTKDEVLPIGTWDDVQVKDGQLTGIPVFDDTDAFAVSIYNKIENGTLRACSVGIVPVETSDAAEHIVPGQRYETWTKAWLRECSIVDMGANLNSLRMYTEDGKEVNLNEPEGARLGLLPLRNEPLNEPINELMNTELQAINAALGIETTSTLAQATAAIDAMKERIAAVELATKSAKIEAMLDKAVSEGKLHASQKEAYRKLALGDYAGVELALQGAVPYQPLAQRMNPAVGEKEAAWSWDDYQQHDKTGVKLAAMREQNPEAFQALYDAKFKH